MIRTPEAHRSGHVPLLRPSRRLHYRLLSLVYAIVLVIICSFPIASFTPARAVASASSESSIYFGLVYPGAPDISILQTKEAQLQHAMSLVLWYQDWVIGGQHQAFPAAQMDTVRAHGSIPVLAWYPAEDGAPSPTQPAYALSKNIDGSWAGYNRQ